MKFIGIIPARYASTRFPGKPLAMLDGKTIIQRVYEQTPKVLEDVAPPRTMKGFSTPWRASGARR